MGNTTQGHPNYLCTLSINDNLCKVSQISHMHVMWSGMYEPYFNIITILLVKTVN
jgi:hypothetical protein